MFIKSIKKKELRTESVSLKLNGLLSAPELVLIIGIRGVLSPQQPEFHQLLS